MKLTTLFLAVFFSLAIAIVPTQAQWQDGNLALKTNGSIFDSGERLRVEIIALADIPESFYTQVSYSFKVKVLKHIEEEKDGKKTERDEEVEETRTRERKAGPLLLNMEQHQTQLLDDTWHFGEGLPGRCITVNVNIFRAYTKQKVATLSSCVCYEDSTAPECSTYLRGFKQLHSNTWISFAGQFYADARYSVLFVNDGKVAQHLQTGIYANDAKELNISAAEFKLEAKRSYDVLVHDHRTGNSSTLSKVIIPLN